MRKGISTAVVGAIFVAIAASIIYVASIKEAPLVENKQQPPPMPGEQIKGKEFADSGKEYRADITPDVSLESCGDKKDLLTTLPLAIDDFTYIVPLGNLAPSAHVFPTQHLYMSVRKVNPAEVDGVPAEVPVYSPADMTITEMSSIKSKKRPNATDFAMWAYPCDEFKIFFDHLKTVSPKIKQAYDDAKTDFCNPYTLTYNDQEGPVDWNFCKKKVSIQIKEGEQIGTAGGGSDQRRFDFGALDYRITPHIYANPERWQYQSDSFYTACALDYFPDEFEIQMKAKLGQGEYAGLKRTIEPVCGTAAQDIPGTAQGTWVPQGFQSLGPENPFLALVHDNLDPRQPAFSIGLSVKTLDRGVYYFKPQSSGLINQDFNDVIPTDIYCYDGLWTGLNSKKEGIILIQLPDEKSLKIEWQNQNSCGNGPWTLTNEASSFER